MTEPFFVGPPWTATDLAELLAQVTEIVDTASPGVFKDPDVVPRAHRLSEALCRQLAGPRRISFAPDGSPRYQ